MKSCSLGLLLLWFVPFPVAGVAETPDQASAVGRYAITPAAGGLYFLDTATGALWFKPSEGDGSWQRVDSPVSAPPREAGGAANSFEIPEGFRVVTVKLDNAPAQGDAIRPRDVVDVFATYESTDSKGGVQKKTKQILTKVQVFAIGRHPINPDDGVRSMSLLVTPEEAAILVLADQKGEIRVALRVK